MDFTVTLIGAGNMGGAMLRGWIANGMSPANLHVVDPSPSGGMQQYLQEAGISHSQTVEGLTPPDVLLVAVKPQMMETVLPTIRGMVGKETMMVSVAAGTTLGTLALPFDDPAIVRVMPNTPSLVGRGMSVACGNERITGEHRARVTQLLQAIGSAEWVEDEKLIDAVTAVSGSGPAYVFYLAECLAKAGENVGLPRDLALTLARETVAGAGELMIQSDDVPSVLRTNVTSPGGTTAAALEVLMSENSGLADLLDRAVVAAKIRSEELAKQ